MKDLEQDFEMGVATELGHNLGRGIQLPQSAMAGPCNEYLNVERLISFEK